MALEKKTSFLPTQKLPNQKNSIIFMHMINCTLLYSFSYQLISLFLIKILVELYPQLKTH